MAQAQPQKASADPVVVDSERYTVVAEDDDVRVLKVKYSPHAKSHMHYHPKHVAIVLTDANCQFTYADGRTEAHNLSAGTTMIVPPGDHLPENLSGESFEAIVVELKR